MMMTATSTGSSSTEEDECRTKMSNKKTPFATQESSKQNLADTKPAARSDTMEYAMDRVEPRTGPVQPQQGNFQLSGMDHSSSLSRKRLKTHADNPPAVPATAKKPPPVAMAASGSGAAAASSRKTSSAPPSRSSSSGRCSKTGPVAASGGTGGTSRNIGVGGRKKSTKAGSAAAKYYFPIRKKGFIDDSEIPENETAEEKKRRLNRNNERRKRARRVMRIDHLTERQQELTEENGKIKAENEALRQQIAQLRDNMPNNAGRRSLVEQERCEVQADTVSPVIAQAPLAPESVPPKASAPLVQQQKQQQQGGMLMRPSADRQRASTTSSASHKSETRRVLNLAASAGAGRPSQALDQLLAASNHNQAAGSLGSSPSQLPPPQQLPVTNELWENLTRERAINDALERLQRSSGSAGQLPTRNLGALGVGMSDLQGAYHQNALLRSLQQQQQPTPLQRFLQQGESAAGSSAFGGSSLSDSRELLRLRLELLQRQEGNALTGGASIAGAPGVGIGQALRGSNSLLSDDLLGRTLLEMGPRGSATSNIGVTDANLLELWQRRLAALSGGGSPPLASLQQQSILGLSGLLQGSGGTTGQLTSTNQLLLALHQQQQRLEATRGQVEGLRSVAGTAGVEPLVQRNLSLSSMSRLPMQQRQGGGAGGMDRDNWGGAALAGVAAGYNLGDLLYGRQEGNTGIAVAAGSSAAGSSLHNNSPTTSATNSTAVFEAGGASGASLEDASLLVQLAAARHPTGTQPTEVLALRQATQDNNALDQASGDSKMRDSPEGGRSGSEDWPGFYFHHQPSG